MDRSEEIQSNLPLTEVTFFILVSLAPAARHGYAIMKDVRSLSNARVRLSTGTLYGALKRLLEQGWIERSDDPAPSDSARARHTPSPAWDELCCWQRSSAWITWSPLPSAAR
jgi:DNA-binding PadR family transcriptional regulator